MSFTQTYNKGYDTFYSHPPCQTIRQPLRSCVNHFTSHRVLSLDKIDFMTLACERLPLLLEEGLHIDFMTLAYERSSSTRDAMLEELVSPNLNQLNIRLLRHHLIPITPLRVAKNWQLHKQPSSLSS